jgi:hypothetical protein
MDLLSIILAISGYSVIFVTTFTSWLYIFITYLVVGRALRYAYKPVELKDRPGWRREADGTALLLFFALMILHFVGIPASWVVSCFGPFGLLLVDLWGMALVALFALIFLVSGIVAFNKMMGFTGEIPKTYIVTPAGYIWIGVGPIVIEVLKVIWAGIKFILMLPIYFVQGFMS